MLASMFKKNRLIQISKVFTFFLSLFLFFPVFAESDSYKKRYFNRINKLVEGNIDKDSRYDFISRYFLGVPYMANTLEGSKNITEKFIINLEAMDCFTYLDYVHSLLDARDYYDFIDNLRSTRYKDAVVSFTSRNHFFYDWEQNIEQIENVTKVLFPQESISTSKYLNKKENGSLYLEGIAVREVRIYFIEPAKLIENKIEKLKSGDYIGIYTKKEGLDVSHVGILIILENKYYFRHASSETGVNSVVDVDFLEYIKDKPGIIIYRNKL